MQKIVEKMSINYSPNFNLRKRSVSKVKYLIFHYTGMKSEKGAIKKIPNIVILSSSIYDGDKEKAKEHENVVSYVSKPLSVDKLENIKILLN